MNYSSFAMACVRNFLFACLVAFAACESANNNDTDEDTSTVSDDPVTQNIQKVLTDVPEPSEIPYQLRATGADFDENLPNQPAKVDQYKTTNNKAALNLGVYATDVGYVSVYEKVQNAINYIEAVEGLGDQLGISNALDPQMQDRFKNNLSNVDSLTSIVDEALKSSDQYLKDNERNSIAAMIFAGSFVEGLYISTQLVDTYPEDLLPEEAKNEVLLGIVRLITEQDKPLNDLLAALKGLEQDDEVSSLVSQFEELAALYKELNIQEKIEKNQGDLILTDETIKGITGKVKEIRDGIVG